MFENLSINNYATFLKYKNSPIFKDYFGHELNFSYLFVQKDFLKIQVHSDTNFIIIKGDYENINFFFPPLANSRLEFNLGIDFIRKYCFNNNLPFIIYGLTDDLLQYINNLDNFYISKKFLELEDALLEQNTDFMDEDNIIFPKIKYSKKPYKIVEYKDKYKGDIIQLHDFLVKQKKSTIDFHSLMDILNNYDDLNLNCDLIYYGKDLMAYIISTTTINNIGIMLVEEANCEIPEIYFVLTYEVNKHFKDCKYICTSTKQIRLQHPRTFKEGVNPLALRTKLILTPFQKLKDFFSNYFVNEVYYQHFFTNQFFKYKNYCNEENKVINFSYFYNIIDINSNDKTFSCLYIPFIKYHNTFNIDKMHKYFKIKEKPELIIIDKENKELFNIGFCEYSYSITSKKPISKYTKTLVDNSSIYTLLELYSKYTSKFNFYHSRKYSSYYDLFEYSNLLNIKIYLLNKRSKVIGYVIEENNEIIEYINLIEKPIFTECNKIIRILNVTSVLSKYPFYTRENIEVKVKIIDKQIQSNNKVVAIVIVNGVCHINDSIDYDFTYDIKDITNLIFHGNNNFEKNKFTELFSNSFISPFI